MQDYIVVFNYLDTDETPKYTSCIKISHIILCAEWSIFIILDGCGGARQAKHRLIDNTIGLFHSLTKIGHVKMLVHNTHAFSLR